MNRLTSVKLSSTRFRQSRARENQFQLIIQTPSWSTGYIRWGGMNEIQSGSITNRLTIVNLSSTRFRPSRARKSIFNWKFKFPAGQLGILTLGGEMNANSLEQNGYTPQDIDWGETYGNALLLAAEEKENKKSKGLRWLETSPSSSSRLSVSHLSVKRGLQIKTKSINTAAFHQRKTCFYGKLDKSIFFVS